MVAGLTIEPLGDRALIVGPGSGGLTPAEGAGRLAAAGLSWLADVVPAYDSLAVVYDPRELVRWMQQGGYSRWRQAEQVRPIADVYGTDPMPTGAVSELTTRVMPYAAAAAVVRQLLTAAMEERAAHAKELAKEPAGEGRIVEIPVLYGGEYGPDLAECAARAGMDEAAFIGAHAAGSYTVAMIGFLPGFPYLAGLQPLLAQPRKAQPRPHVPAGSVGIAGVQTGIYPFGSPGGWQIIGRTPVKLFDPENGRQPSLLRAGDRVRFVPVAADAAEVSPGATAGGSSCGDARDGAVQPKGGA